MSKTIKIIDLLNKIANGEDVPKFIKHKDTIYKYDKEAKTYYEVNQNKGIYIAFDTDELNDYIGIIEEQQDIDIQKIEDIKDVFIENAGCGEDVKYLAKKYNELVQAVKQLDKNIKDKE